MRREKLSSKSDGYRQSSTVRWYSCHHLTGNTLVSLPCQDIQVMCSTLAWLEFKSQLCWGFFLPWSLFPQCYLESEVVCLLLYYNLYCGDACRENHVFVCLEKQNVMCMWKYIVLRAWLLPSCKLWCHFKLWTGSAARSNKANIEL